MKSKNYITYVHEDLIVLTLCLALLNNNKYIFLSSYEATQALASIVFEPSDSMS